MKKKNILSLTRVFKFALIFVLTCTINISDINEEPSLIAIEDTPYYEGKYNTINFAANMIDDIEKDNILISPFNINSTMAALYSLDNSLSSYFEDSIDNVNNYYLSKMNKYKTEKKKKTKKEEYYEKLIKEFYDNNYEKISVQTINKMGTEARNNLIRDIKKILLSEESLNNKNITIKQLDNYTIKNNELNMNNQSIIYNINKIVWNYNLYIKKNYINNISNLYYDSQYQKLDLKSIKEKYLVNSSLIDFSNLEEINEINNKIYKETNKNINYLVDKKDQNSNSLIVSSFVFDYTWDNLIDSNKNSYADFYINEEIISVEMLNFTSDNYLENNSALGFIKDYENNHYSFVGILPKYENKLSSINIEELLNNKKEVNINISIPRFSITDFNSIKNDVTIKENIPLDNYYQKNTFNFLEGGTYNLESPLLETNNIAVLSSLENIEFNHPFYFLIIDNDNNCVLLAGKITNPSI